MAVEFNGTSSSFFVKVVSFLIAATCFLLVRVQVVLLLSSIILVTEHKELNTRDQASKQALLQCSMKAFIRFTCVYPIG